MALAHLSYELGRFHANEWILNIQIAAMQINLDYDNIEHILWLIGSLIWSRAPVAIFEEQYSEELSKNYSPQAVKLIIYLRQRHIYLNNVTELRHLMYIFRNDFLCLIY
jgi:hypothetical protein